MGAATSGGLAQSAAIGAVGGAPVLGTQAVDRVTGGNLNNAVGGALQDPLGALSTGFNRAGQAFGATGFARPQLANVQQGTSVQDVQNAQSGTANALGSQQNLLNALNAQNGIGAQTGLSNQLAAANGVGTQNSAIQGLQGTAGMYQNVAQGRGPNPAQAMLNQATGQNVANQAALMAGQRGAGANVGLLARQAGQQGANIQQQAVGQGATQQAQQQLGALSGLSNTQQAIGGLGSTQAGMQQGLANQMAGQQISGTNALTQANLANQAQMQGALQGVNQANIANQGSVNAANAGITAQQMKGQQGIVGGVLNGAGAAIGMAEGGAVPAETSDPQGASSTFGKFLKGWYQTPQPSEGQEEDEVKGGASKLTGALAGLAMASKGGLAKSGGHVAAKKESQKPEKKGDSYKNDKVPAMLSAGEIVIPRSVAMGKDPVKNSARFVREVLAKRKAAS